MGCTAYENIDYEENQKADYLTTVIFESIMERKKAKIQEEYDKEREEQERLEKEYLRQQHLLDSLDTRGPKSYIDNLIITEIPKMKFGIIASEEEIVKDLNDRDCEEFKEGEVDEDEKEEINIEEIKKEEEKNKNEIDELKRQIEEMNKKEEEEKNKKKDRKERRKRGGAGFFNKKKEENEEEEEEEEEDEEKEKNEEQKKSIKKEGSEENKKSEEQKKSSKKEGSEEQKKSSKKEGSEKQRKNRENEEEKEISEREISQKGREIDSKNNEEKGSNKIKESEEGNSKKEKRSSRIEKSNKEESNKENNSNKKKNKKKGKKSEKSNSEKVSEKKPKKDKTKEMLDKMKQLMELEKEIPPYADQIKRYKYPKKAKEEEEKNKLIFSPSPDELVLCIIGEEKNGKTSFIKKYTRNTFDQVYKQTEEIDTYDEIETEIDSKKIKLKILDTPALNIKKNIKLIQEKGINQSHIIIYIMDINDEYGEMKVRLMSQSFEFNEKQIMVVIGNKSDKIPIFATRNKESIGDFCYFRKIIFEVISCADTQKNEIEKFVNDKIIKEYLSLNKE